MKSHANGIPSNHKILHVIRSVRERYPMEMRPQFASKESQLLFDISLALSSGGKSICDLGGGLSPFTACCAALGLSATLIDDFHDPVNDVYPEIVTLIEQAGVRVIRRHLVADGVPEFDVPFHIVTSFHSIEHWHHSPRQVLHQALSSMSPGGLFVLAVPNCVNLRKRFAYLLGAAEWSSMKDWYDRPVFRGHVREPNVRDLRYIATDLGLNDVSILGRNFLGERSSSRLTRLAASVLRPALERAPSMCSDLYLVGKRREH